MNDELFENICIKYNLCCIKTFDMLKGCLDNKIMCTYYHTKYSSLNELAVYNKYIFCPGLKAYTDTKHGLLCTDDNFEIELKKTIDYYHKYIKEFDKKIEMDLKKKIIENDFI